jgi:divalent metal cation (Fe/Co/Zn/Cd) transporter
MGVYWNETSPPDLSAAVLSGEDAVDAHSKLIRKGVLVEYVSLAWMTVECAAAIYAGIAVWSLALLAFGGDSFVELLSSVAVVQHLKSIMRRPEGSADHVENKQVEWATGLLLVSLIPVIGLTALYSFLNGLRPESSLLGILVAASAVVIMPILWYEKKTIGAASNCLPLTIDASESSTCFYMSTALLVGLAVNYATGIWWTDYVATFVILGLVAREAVESIREIR